MKTFKDCLDLDWNNLDALLGLTEILVRPGMDRTDELKSGILDDFMRVLSTAEKLAPEQCERLTRIFSDRSLEPATPPEHLKHQFVESLRALSCGSFQDATQSLQAMLLVKVPTFVFWHQRHLIHHRLGRSLEAVGQYEQAIQEYVRAVALAPSHRDSLARLAALGAEDSSSNIAERLQELTPEVPWEIDFSGKIRLLGTTLAPEGGVQPSSSPLPSGEEGIGMAEAPEEAAIEKSPSGEEDSGLAPEAGAFVARYYWMVEDDLDPADFDASYRYFNAEGNLLFVDSKSLRPQTQTPLTSLDGGIGSVIVHEHPVPFPPQVAREVQIQVRRLPKGKIPAEVLKSIAGSTWVTLGLLTPQQGSE
jgi:tetratricopeptide (TPR) repeat protein